jgi:hypothetical protein
MKKSRFTEEKIIINFVDTILISSAQRGIWVYAFELIIVSSELL